MPNLYFLYRERQPAYADRTAGSTGEGHNRHVRSPPTQRFAPRGWAPAPFIECDLRPSPVPTPNCPWRPTSLDHSSDAVGQQKTSPGENRDGQGTATIEQGSAQAQEGEGQDHRRPTVPEGRRARSRKSQE